MESSILAFSSEGIFSSCGCGELVQLFIDVAVEHGS